MEGSPIAIGEHIDEISARRIAQGEFSAAHLAQMQDRIARGDAADEIVRVRPNGTVVALRTARLPEGGHISVVTDVTAVHRAEAAARERAELLDAVLEALPEGVVVYGADGRAKVSNAAYRRIMGSAAVRPGESFEELGARRVAAGELTEELSQELMRRHFGPVEEAGRPIRRLRPDGTAIVTRAGRLPDGGHIAVISDVTALHRAEQELRQRAAMQDAMLSNVRHGIILYGPDRRVLATNARTSELTGMPAESLVPGRLMDDLIDEQMARGQIAPAQGAAMKAFDRSQPQHYSRSKPDGRVLDTYSEPTPDGGYVITYSDITEERAIRAELETARAAAEAASQAKSRFLATMSHELRTPLNAIIGLSEAIATEREKAVADEYAALVNEAGKHLLSLVDDILDVARSQTGALRVENAPFCSAEVVEAALAATRPAAEAARLELTGDLPHALPLLRGDPRRLRQVLDKLLSNAVKFTPQGGRIRVTACEEAGGIAIRVADTGIGIPEDERERMFEPFTQLDASLARRFQGSGLGLHLARTLTTALGGTLTLEAPEGPGIVAVLRFPPDRVVRADAAAAVQGA
ncbi:PAS-domain containing protein [Leptolyngbya sp. 15MV]|nr:PAS-domain containing protein [Leptolyngbya sp. 15MV]